MGLEGQTPRESSVCKEKRMASREPVGYKGGQGGFFFLLDCGSSKPLLSSIGQEYVCSPCGKGHKLGCILESPRELFKIQMPRPCPR